MEREQTRVVAGFMEAHFISAHYGLAARCATRGIYGKELSYEEPPLSGGILCFVLGILALIPSVFEFIQIQSYQAGRRTILAKHLLRQTRVQPDFSGGGVSDEVPILIPDFQFLVQAADGHFHQAQGYALDLSLDADNYAPWNDQSYGQAIVNAYEVGRTYPCWYNSANPTQAVLTQYLDPPFLAQAVLLLPVGGILAIVAMLRWKWHQSRRAVWATGGATRAWRRTNHLNQPLHWMA